MQKVIWFRINKGPKFALEMVKEETDLTADMLASGAWKSATFSELLPKHLTMLKPLCCVYSWHFWSTIQAKVEREAFTHQPLSQNHTTSRPWAQINTLALCTR
jgi:hypothetical protein